MQYFSLDVKQPTTNPSLNIILNIKHQELSHKVIKNYHTGSLRTITNQGWWSWFHNKKTGRHGCDRMSVKQKKNMCV